MRFFQASMAKLGSDAAREEYGKKVLRTHFDNEADFIQNVHVIVDKQGVIRPFRWNYAQKKFYEDVIVYCRRNGLPIRAMVLKARRLGFSTFMQSWQYEQLDRIADQKALTMSYDDPHSNMLFEISKTIHAHHPCPRKIDRSRDGLLRFARPHGSEFTVRTAGTNVGGRGYTFQYAHFSEIAMYTTAESVMLGVINTVDRSANTAIVLESTARGAQGLFYSDWRRAEANESDYVPFFAPWFWDPKYVIEFASKDHRNRFMQTLRPEEKVYMERHGLTPEQMNWRAYTIRNQCQGSVANFQQEYPASAAEAFLSSGFGVFDGYRVQELESVSKPPQYRAEVLLIEKGDSLIPEIARASHGSLRVWDDPAKLKRYVVGVDVAESRQRDIGSSTPSITSARDRPDHDAAVVIELESGQHVATWHGNRNASEFSAIVAGIGWYYNNALVVVEQNGPGSAVIDLLVQLFRYENLYRSVIFSRSTLDITPSDFGWRTTASSKELLIARIHEILLDPHPFTLDKALIGELRTMVYDSQGRPRARGRDKDDLVMALGMALRARYEALVGYSPERAKINPYEGMTRDQVYEKMIEKKEQEYADGLCERRDSPWIGGSGSRRSIHRPWHRLG